MTFDHFHIVNVSDVNAPMVHVKAVKYNELVLKQEIEDRIFDFSQLHIMNVTLDLYEQSELDIRSYLTQETLLFDNFHGELSLGKLMVSDLKVHNVSRREGNETKPQHMNALFSVIAKDISFNRSELSNITMVQDFEYTDSQ